MAFTLTIKSKGLFNKAKSIDLEAILKIFLRQVLILITALL